MQVRGNSRSYVRHFEKARQAISVERIDHHANGKREQSEEPPALPNRWQNGEGQCRGCRAGQTLRVHGAHEKAITAGREIRIIHTAMIAQYTPIFIRAFQPILIAQHLAGTEVQPDEVNIKLILIRAEIESRQFSLTQLRDGINNAGNSQPTYQNWWRLLLLVRSWDKSRQAVDIARKPQHPVTITVSARYLTDQQTISGGEMLDVTGVRIESIQAAASPNIDVARPIFRHAPDIVAG